MFIKKYLEKRSSHCKFSSTSVWVQAQAAVSCSATVPQLGGVKMGLGLTNKLGLAWVGARVVHGCTVMAHNYPCTNLCTDPCKAQLACQPQPHFNKIYLCLCVFICSVKRIIINERVLIGANLKKIQHSSLLEIKNIFGAVATNILWETIIF